MKNPKLIAASACPSSASSQFGLKTGKASSLRLLLALALVFAGATSHASIPNAPPDRIGCFSEILDPSGTTTYERDAQGRVTTKTQRLINGDTRSVSYAYNPQGLLASTTYPGGQVLQNVYNTTGQITGLTWAGQPLVTGITWNPLGQPTGWSWSLPGGTAAIPATRSYNTAGQLTATDFSSYQYDAAGRIHTLTQKLWRPANTNPQASTISQATSTWTVQYSPAGRITGFTKNTAANAPVDTATFSYDANGNRTTSTRDLAGTATSRTYGGDASHNRLLGFEQTATAGSNSASTSVTYQYNTAGDLLGDGLTTYRYDSEGRMESASTGQGEDAPTTKYAHNALGQRVFKTEPLYASSTSTGNKTGKNLNNLLADDDEPQAEPPGLIQQILSFFSKLWSPSTSDAEKLGFSYVYAEDGSLLGEYGSGGSNSTGTAQYIYLPTASGPMPIAAVIKGQTYAVHSDHLNTPRKLTQPDGQVAWQWAYSAFGDEQPTIGAKRFTSESTNPTTGATSIPEVTFNLRYPGQYFDKETKLHYNYFRTYAPSTGRYTQGDPIGLDGGWNRFGYVGGNPLSYTDPSGLAPHEYNWRVFRCMGDCSAQTMRELLCNPAPGVYPRRPTQTGDVNTVGLGPFTLGPITTAVSPNSMTTWNLTMPGHMLHPGWVRRDVVVEGGATWIVNSGGGDGFNPMDLNDVLAPIVWGGRNPVSGGPASDCLCQR